jgi:hypothetical protein
VRHALSIPQLLLPAGLLLACAREKPVEPVAIPSVLVMASDYAFQMPDTLTAGVTSFRIMNHGTEAHHLTLVRLPDGMTLADFQKLNPAAPPPPSLVFAGGPNFAAPGGAVEAIVDLKPGHYIALCAIPSPDGTLHMAKGMVHEFHVVPARDAARQAAATVPDADATVRLGDYSFTASPPLTAGRHVLRVENIGGQWHEMVLVKLEAGKTVEDMARWAEKPEGPPPGSPVDGVAPVSPGESNTVTVNLTPGDYGFICFLADARDGKPHLMHGMIQQFSVR